MSEGWGSWGDVQASNVQRLATASAKWPLDVVFYGDSITACLYNYPMAKAPGCEHIFKKHFGDLNAVACAIAGDQIGNLVWRLKEGHEVQHPKVAVVLIGINDLIGWGAIPGVPRWPSTKARMEFLLKTMCALMPSTKIVVASLTPAHGTLLRIKRNALNNTYAFVCTKLKKQGLNIEFVDCAKGISAENGGPVSSGILADGVHLTAHGHDLHLGCLRSKLNRFVSS